MTDISDKQRLEGALKGVMRDLSALAPHPDQPGNKGPVFVKARGPANDEREAMLGCLLFECVVGSALGEAFADAVNAPGWAHAEDWDKAADVADEYWLTRRDDRAGVFTRAPAKPLDLLAAERRNAAFKNDLPARLLLEGRYAELARHLDDLERMERDGVSVARPFGRKKTSGGKGF